MWVIGYSINALTMFGMVLAIGIIVDDAIVVVENVERLMATEALSPHEATSRAMREITGAVVGITLVLTAVFLPMGLATGSVGAIYRQFTVSLRGFDPLLGLPRAQPDAGALCHDPEADRTASRKEGLLRVVQSRLRAADRSLYVLGRISGEAWRAG